MIQRGDIDLAIKLNYHEIVGVLIKFRGFDVNVKTMHAKDRDTALTLCIKRDMTGKMEKLNKYDNGYHEKRLEIIDHNVRLFLRHTE